MGAETALPVLDLNKKRPAKKLSETFILNSFAALTHSLPGATKENIKAQIAFQNAYLYESEVTKILEDKKNEKGFDPKAFVSLLQFCGCVKAGATPAIGEGMVRIDSEERAKEVANDPKYVNDIVAIMQQITDLRKKVDPMINKHASLSVALKNLKDKGEKKSESK